MFSKKRVITEVPLRKHYRFMYENFVIATQYRVYLLLEKRGDLVDAIEFDSHALKYGSPNDEAIGGHPLSNFDPITAYALCEVANSPWIHEMMVANRVHHGHSDAMFDGLRHFILVFKDVTFEVVATDMREVEFTQDQVLSILAQQLECLETLAG